MARTRPFAQRAAISFGMAAVGMTVTSLVTQHELPSVVEVVVFVVVWLVCVAVIAPVARRRVRAGRSDRL
ncbi:hypothetical protein [Streptomyces sp. NBC_00203]|uniref:hypothetical protein n=1 Tax=Streptomyces sp. NBC_00203 TaxID=2975680 RepID=UPI00324569B7